MVEAVELVTSGKVLADRYELIQAIASGGMAQVWIASDLVANESVAVKILHPHLTQDEKFISRFRREAQAAYKLSHPSIVSIKNSISEKNLEAIVMELIEGQTLRKFLDDYTTMPPEIVIDLGSSISSGLHIAHQKGIIHRDIKPANIMICEDGRAVITDFGIAKASEDSDLTATGMLLGTAKYLSPEQVTGHPVQASSDVYSLAIVLFEALTGVPPFSENTEAATALARIQNPAPTLQSINSKFAGQLSYVIAKALEKDPYNRYQTAIEFKTALDAIDKNKIGQNNQQKQTRIHEVKSDQELPINNFPVQSNFPEELSTGSSKFKKNSYKVKTKNKYPTWFTPLLLFTFVLSALAFAGFLIMKAANSFSSDNASPGQIEIINQDVVEGEQSGDEHNDLAKNSWDNNSKTFWKTDTYPNVDISSQKGGVGIIYRLKSPSDINSVKISTPSKDWKLQLLFYSEDSASINNPTEIIDVNYPLSEDDLIKVNSKNTLFFRFNVLQTGTTNKENFFQLNEITLYDS